MNKNKFFFILLFTIYCLLFTATAKAEDNFDPNYIISDFEMLDYDSMTLAEIAEFLQDKSSYLANYITENAYGAKKSAAEIIYDAAVNNYDCDDIALSDGAIEAERKVKCKKITTVSPKFLLVLLQKEMSLIEDSTPKQSQLDWATGYGCPDGSSCNPRWQGFGKQVNSAALQFKDYLDNPHLYTYKIGGNYTFTNPYSTTAQGDVLVTPASQATAALYNYTPHVYNGNYNFYKIWQRYFTRNYPDGSLLQAEGESGVWLIQEGNKRPFLSKGALTSRFDENKIIIVNKSDLDAYVKGAPIKFPNYSLIRSPRGTIFLLVDDKRRGLASSEAFRNIGFNPEEVVDASWEDINGYREGAPITATSTYPTGALLQNKKTGGVYWVSEGEKAPLLDAIFLKTKFKNKNIIPVTPEELENYITVDPCLYGDGELVKSPISSAVYLIADGKKRPFISGEAFEDLGYKWKNIITVSPKVLYLYEEGEMITNNQ